MALAAIATPDATPRNGEEAGGRAVRVWDDAVPGPGWRGRPAIPPIARLAAGPVSSVARRSLASSQLPPRSFGPGLLAGARLGPGWRDALSFDKPSPASKRATGDRTPLVPRGGVLRRRRHADQDQHRARVRVLRAAPADAARLARRRRVKTALSIPVFWAADKLSRKWFNELFYRYYEGAVGGPARRARRGAVRGRHQAEHLPARARSDRRDAARRLPPGAGLGRARLHDAAARALPRRRRPDRQPARVRRRLRDRQAGEAVRRRRDQGGHHARLRRAARHRSRASRGPTPTATRDYPMLAVVGHPTACNPDFRLRSLARSYDWPVLDLDEEPRRAASRSAAGARCEPRSGEGQ